MDKRTRGICEREDTKLVVKTTVKLGALNEGMRGPELEESSRRDVLTRP